jgi:glycine/D-amino acid oxidase-like deaminating enzyme
MFDVVVCGAGIAGVSTAFHLRERGVREVAVVDPRPPLSLTSEKSTECYRNWWPARPMVALMNRSIDLLDAYAHRSGNAFRINRRGYLYVTGDRRRLAEMERSAQEISALGAGDLRLHDQGSQYQPGPFERFDQAPNGADLFLDAEGLLTHFPFLSQDAVGGLHVRRAGWLSAQQLGAWMIRESGPRMVRGRVVSVEKAKGRVKGVRLEDGSRIPAGAVVNAAGPMLAEVGHMAGVELPVHNELHHTLAFRDRGTVVPRSAPMIIWSDPQRLSWSEEEKGLLAAEGRRDLLEELPPHCHGRPEGGEASPWFLGLWEYRKLVSEPVWPLPHDPMYPEVVLRGLVTMVPGLASYLERMPAPTVDGGYYTKAPDNRPLIGPAGPEGCHVVGALSGFGVMAACAAGELAALHVSGGRVPDYADSFTVGRFDRPGYLEELGGSDAGQL